jgi:phosphatidylglycerol---prolipoprotein diacylglyceryl transferase
MYPDLFKISNISVSSYAVMVLIAFIIGYFVMLAEFKRKGLSENLNDLVFAAAIIGGIGGAKVLFLFQNAALSEFLAEPMRFLASGLTSWGGLLTAIFLWFLIAAWKKLSFWLVTDAVAPALILVYGIGRIGCFLVGDDYGTPSALPWAISFPNGSPPTTDRVHPTQLYDTLLMFIAFAFIWKIRKKSLPTGLIFAITLIILGVERFFIEFIRDTSPSFIPLLSQAQLISIGVIIIGIYKLIQLRSHLVKSSEVQA